MVKVNVATLKAELSHYLEIVENGEQVLVTSHGKEIAKIGPAFQSHVAPVNWGDFLKEHPPIKTKIKGEDAARLMRKIRDEE
ncbi:MAG: type II toxin-antitoxin system prevent-host-death family antitoxin [Deltaproteobacteria bacterium]|nr:type II toxin-antitoxin system prevent-host-death family antitoxin [Deltaproteobacteria bacterium]